MTVSDADYERLLGDLPLLGVEAAAGAGKTHLACTVAFAEVARLKPHQEVLFLSHTNAAREVFRRRISSEGRLEVGISVKTLDTFCLELLSPYAGLWDLPVPLRPPTPVPRDWFLDARRKAATLLKKRFEIAQAIAAHYPVVIADEHQDASIHHHSMLVALANAGARVRMFGDALQAILTFDKTIPGWDQLMEGVPIIELSGAWRWKDVPKLGAWISDARTKLRSGGRVSLASSTDAVRVIALDGASRQAWTRNPEVLKVLSEMRDRSSLVVLARRNDQVKEITRVTNLGLIVNEGSDQSAVEEVVAEATAAIGDSLALANAIADFMIGSGTLEPSNASSIRAMSAQPNSEALSNILTVIKQQPNLSGLVLAIRLARRHALALGWVIAHPIAVDTVAGLPVTVGVDEVRDLLYQAQRAATESIMPVRCASTIHKAKGREFDNVVLPSIDASTFGPELKDRQLLYVALSRARRQLTLIVPKINPSSLVAW